MQNQNKLIEVCDSCLCASCWHGEFMCDSARSSGTVKKTVLYLNELGLESKDHYSDEKLIAMYGNSAPYGYDYDKNS